MGVRFPRFFRIWTEGYNKRPSERSQCNETQEGIEEVPCVFVDYLTEAQKKAYIIADNRFAQDAGWDEELLRIEIEALQGMDFDVGLTGFNDDEIADFFAGDDKSEAEDDDFDLSAALEKASFVQRGDIWTVGRHVNVESIIIAELRLLLFIIESCGVDYCIGLGNVMNRRFTSFDFIADEASFEDKYHIVIGNPPYVEDFKSGLELSDKYGNIYANILLNAARKLEKNGSIGFIIPLSYVSTPRMKKLREELGDLVSEQYILSYADRPDCLFDSVHQKLCILIGKDRKVEKTVFTGNYQYWYKQERGTLFTDIQMVRNRYENADFIPKLGTQLDIDIYKKITDTRKMQSVYAISRAGTESVFLNRREAFWMKAYREKVDDPEYKVFSFHTPLEADFCYCLINSTLFWWYWISVSDCWHVSKDLNGFMMPLQVDMTGARNWLTT